MLGNWLISLALLGMCFPTEFADSPVKSSYGNACFDNELQCDNQIPGSAVNDCVISNFKVRNESGNIKNVSDCFNTANYPDWAISSESAGYDHTEYSEFDVHLGLFKYEYSGVNFSGLNLTLHVYSNFTKGFLISLEIVVINFYTCRLFDFHRLQKPLRLYKDIFWYDCFHFTSSEANTPYLVKVKELPHGSVKSFRGEILHPDDIGYSDVVKWKPSIYTEISEGKQSLDVWFQLAPAKFKFSHYRVQLLEITDNITEKVVQEQDVNVAHSTRLSHRVTLDYRTLNGHYVIDVTPYNETFNGTTSRFSRMSYKMKGQDQEYDPQTYVVIGVVGVLLTSLLSISFCRRRHFTHRHILGMTDDLGDKCATLLVIYSYDNAVHFEVVRRHVALLKAFGVKVIVDFQANMNQQPRAWLDKQMDAADYVLIIWSEGGITKMAEQKPLLLENEPDHSLTKYFHAAVELATHHQRKYLSKRSVINIQFSYSPKYRHKSLSMALSKTFALPHQWHDLMVHLHSSSNYCTCCMSSIFEEYNLKQCQEGKDFLDAIQKMESYQLAPVSCNVDVEDASKGNKMVATQNKLPQNGSNQYVGVGTHSRSSSISSQDTDSTGCSYNPSDSLTNAGPNQCNSFQATYREPASREISEVPADCADTTETMEQYFMYNPDAVAAASLAREVVLGPKWSGNNHY